jgi:hypothetical protein
VLCRVAITARLTHKPDTSETTSNHKLVLAAVRGEGPRGQGSFSGAPCPDPPHALPAQTGIDDLADDRSTPNGQGQSLPDLRGAWGFWKVADLHMDRYERTIDNATLYRIVAFCSRKCFVCGVETTGFLCLR